MKILESQKNPPEPLSSWLTSLLSLSDSDFLTQISQINEWEFEEQEDLSCLIPLFNKIDDLLSSCLSSPVTSRLPILLSFTSVIIAPVQNKTLYNSFQELYQCLDHISCEVVFSALKLLKSISLAQFPKQQRLAKHDELLYKAYVIGMGGCLNSPSPVSIKDLLTCSVCELEFCSSKSSGEELSEQLKYVLLNRERTNAHLGSPDGREMAVACQLLALSVFLLNSSDTALIQEFCRSLPEVWLVPFLADLVRTPQSLEVCTSSLYTIASILSGADGSRNETLQMQISSRCAEAFTSWSALGATLLRDIAAADCSSAPLVTHPQAVDAVLELLLAVLNSKQRAGRNAIASITSGILCLFKASVTGNCRVSLGQLCRACGVLISVMPSSLEVFKENEGLLTMLELAVLQIKTHTDGKDCKPSENAARKDLIRCVLKIIKTALSKWDQEPGSASADVNLVLQSGILESFNCLFSGKAFEVYEEAITLLTQLINEFQELVGEVIAKDTITVLLQSLEEFMPRSSKFVDVLARFLCISAFNIEGAKIIERFSTVSNMLSVLGNASSVFLSNNTAANIAESILELITSIPTLRDKVIEGALLLIKSLKNSEVSKPELFWQQISNIGRLLANIFQTNPEIIKGFISRGGIDSLFEVFSMKIKPKSANNEFYTLISCLKSLQLSLVSQVLSKVLHFLNVSLEKIQEFTGPFNEIQNFSRLEERTDDLLYLLLENDCFLETIRVLLSNWAGITNNYKEFLDILSKIYGLQRILISEQARLLCKFKIKDYETSKFNIPADPSFLESAENKSLEENLYFLFQMTIRRVFRTAMRIPNNRGRQFSNEEAGLAISKSIGELLSDSIKSLDFSEISYERLYFYTLLITDVNKIVFFEQNASPACILTFVSYGGISNLNAFLINLKKISHQVAMTSRFSYHLCNSLQLLWTLSGKFLENLVAGKFTGSSYGQLVIKALGFSSCKEVIKMLQNSVAECLKSLNYLEPGELSTSFAKSVLEILKLICNLNKEPMVDGKLVKVLTNMGFPVNVSKRALMMTGNTSVDMAMEWIFSHPDSMNAPGDTENQMNNSGIEDLHLVILNAVPAIYSLSTIAAEILLKITASNEETNEETAMSLLSIAGSLAFQLLSYRDLMDVTAGMVRLSLPNIPASFAQLGSCLAIIQTVISKNSAILELIKENNFTGHLVNFLKRATASNAPEHWFGSVFGIIEVFVKSGEVCSEETLSALISTLWLKDDAGASVIKEPDLLKFLNLVISITYIPSLAKLFVNEGGFKSLMLLKKPETEKTSSKPIVLPWGELLKQVCEDPLTLQSCYEVAILQVVNPEIPLDQLLRHFKAHLNRDNALFSKAVTNACRVINQKDRVIVRQKQKIPEICNERWNSIQLMCEAFCEIFNREQLSEQKSYLTSDMLADCLGNVLFAYPLQIDQILHLKVEVYNPATNAFCTDFFLSQMLKVIIPFRYPLQFRGNKIIHALPVSLASVPAEVWNNWIKVSVKLLKSLSFKQVYKSPESPLSAVYAEKVLANNVPAGKARKKLIRTLKEILLENTKSQWFEELASLSLVKSVAIVVLQILKEPPRSPFIATSCVEIAKMLICEGSSMVKLFSEALKSIDLSLKRTSKIMSLLVGTLELLTKYLLHFALKLNKPLDSNIEVYALIPEDSPALPVRQEAEESSLSEEDRRPLEDIVIEGLDNEVFWVDENDSEEEGRFRRPTFIEPRQDSLVVERVLLENEQPQGQSHLRSMFREFEEHMAPNIPWRELENDNFIQILLQRNRNLYRQEAPAEPTFVRVVESSNEFIQQTADEIIMQALEEPMEEDEKPVENQPCLEVRENGSIRESAVPEGLDPEVLAELPEDIRREVLAAYNRPKRDASAVATEQNENARLNEEFLQALPHELRNEVLGQSRPQRSSPEMDNAVFIASLTPELREEVLMTATEEFLSTLPPDLVAEARLMHERNGLERQSFRARPPPVPRIKPQVDEHIVVKDLVNDDKLSCLVTSPDDGFLEVLLRLLYMSSGVHKEILSSLMLNVTVNDSARSKIIDGLARLLCQTEPKGAFPPSILLGAEDSVENFRHVYAVVSIRMLEVLYYLASFNPKVPEQLTKNSIQQLGLVNNIELLDTNGLLSLIALLRVPLFQTSACHLTPLITLLAQVLRSLPNAIPELNPCSLSCLCALLSYESLNNSTVKTVVDILTQLAQLENNKEMVILSLKTSLVSLSRDVHGHLEKLQTSQNGLKEAQILRIVKVLHAVSGTCEDVDFLWSPLSVALNQLVVHEKQVASTSSPVFSKLLPLIEAFFLSHVDRMQAESFRLFTEKCSKIVNDLVRHSPSLLQDSLALLVKRFPFLLDFENKRSYFKAKLKELKPERGYDSIRLHVRRHEVFMDSFHQLKVRSPSEMHGKLRVQFVGEEGIDAGGLTREWYELLAREMFNPNYALFIPSSNGVSFQPNSMSSINSEHIQFFKFIGRIIGKAVCDGQSLEVYFTRSFYKHILGQEVNYQDMEDLDVEFFKSLKALIDINLTESENELHEYYFAYEEEEFGKISVKELVQEGRNIRVTEGNKIEYIKLLCNAKMTSNIQSQISAFKDGFYELIAAELIAIFDSKELELLISGLPNIDLDDLRANTEYSNYNKESQVIVWLWEVLHEFSPEEKAEFLQFVTGSSKVPLDGFQALPGMDGFQKFQVHKSFASVERLPTAHTCINQLDLPEYTSREELRAKLKFAISEGKEGFGFA